MTNATLIELEKTCGFALTDEEREGALAVFNMMESYETTLAECDTSDYAPMYRAGRPGAKADRPLEARNFAADIAMEGGCEE